MNTSLVDLEEILDTWPVLRACFMEILDGTRPSLAMILGRVATTLSGLTSAGTGLVYTRRQVTSLSDDLDSSQSPYRDIASTHYGQSMRPRSPAPD